MRCPGQLVWEAPQEGGGSSLPLGGSAHVEDGRNPQPHEDRRPSPVPALERERGQDRDDRPFEVDPLANIRDLTSPCRFVKRLLPSGYSR